MPASRLRSPAAIAVALTWAVTLPLAADALRAERQTLASFVFVLASLAMAGLWWLHMRERAGRIGMAAGLSGWLFIGSIALLGVAGFIWVLVVVALLAAAVAYAVVLLVAQARASHPRRELVTGLLLFATAGAAASLALTTGLGDMDAWWLPLHLLLGVGIGSATVIGTIPGANP